jgi:hypothetical protein
VLETLEWVMRTLLLILFWFTAVSEACRFYLLLVDSYPRTVSKGADAVSLPLNVGILVSMAWVLWK